MNFPKRASIISLMKKTAINLTDGPILRSIITFAIPMIISNIFQQLYNTADIMIVGRFLGQDALAAVGFLLGNPKHLFFYEEFGV